MKLLKPISVKHSVNKMCLLLSVVYGYEGIIRNKRREKVQDEFYTID